MQQRLNDQILESYMRDFFGYGPLSSPYWCIGIEEGGGEEFEQVQQRLSFWNRAHYKTADLVDFHKGMGILDSFSGTYPLQRTWCKLMRTVFCAKGISQFAPELDGEATIDNQRIASMRHYQVHSLAREVQGNTIALLELLPLPCRSIRHWHYGQWSNLPQLASKRSYTARYAPLRVQALKNLIAQHKPAVVVCYGKGHQRWWEEIAGVPLVEGEPTIGPHGALYIKIKHPSATGITTAYFHAAGRQIAAALAAKQRGL